MSRVVCRVCVYTYTYTTGVSIHLYFFFFSPSQHTQTQHEKKKTSEDAVTSCQPFYTPFESTHKACVEVNFCSRAKKKICCTTVTLCSSNDLRLSHRTLSVPVFCLQTCLCCDAQTRTRWSLFRTDTQRGVLSGLSRERNLRSKI